MAFQKADNYRQKFEPYRDFYRQNEALDVEKFKEEDHGQSITTARATLWDTPSNPNLTWECRKLLHEPNTMIII